MTSEDEVRKLAALARIAVPDEELATFVKEFESILAYVGQIEQLTVSADQTAPPVRNVLREDGVPHESGIYTHALAEQFPARADDALSVKQIISHD